MSLNGFILLCVSAVLTTVANLLLRSGITHAGGFRPHSVLDAARQFLGLLVQPRFSAGFIMYFLASLVWFRVVAYEPLSIAYPLLVGLTFILVTSGAVLAFGESISLQKLIGLSTILTGILIASTSHSTHTS